MSQLLFIESSPRKQRSSSSEAAQSYIEAFTSASPENTVTTLNLWEMHLPEFDGERLNAKYSILHGQNPSAQEAKAWEEVVEVIEQFKQAERYLISLPMWNFSIPYKLKHYIDIITQPGLTFSFSPESGYKGLVTGKPATVIYARGGEYSSGDAQAMDYQKPYLETLLSFIGFTDINPVIIEPTLGDPVSASNALKTSIEKAKELGRRTQ